eukprot:3318124-Alexandrium_andersonii.AAC.1
MVNRRVVGRRARARATQEDRLLEAGRAAEFHVEGFASSPPSPLGCLRHISTSIWLQRSETQGARARGTRAPSARAVALGPP